MLQLSPGVVFARDYRIVKALAEGGMGSVYVAEQISTGKPRALKLMHAQLAADPRSRARFEQEARIGATLDSDHIVEVVGAGIDEPSGTPWLAMELLKGEDLAAVVERRGAIAPHEVAAVYEQLGHALGAAHAANIVHRDLKPENIFLAVARRRDVPFTVKLLDFGIAKIVQECRTSTTQAMGSPLWMAPEQTESTGISPATDVWALGLIAFYLLTGEYYWRSARLQDGSAMMQLLREILVEPLVSVSVRAQESGVFPMLPQGFEGWFHRCVVRERSERFADANAATQGLVNLLRAQAAAHPSWDPSLAHPSTLPGPLPAAGLGGSTGAPTPAPPTYPPAHAATQPAPHHPDPRAVSHPHRPTSPSWAPVQPTTGPGYGPPGAFVPAAQQTHVAEMWLGPVSHPHLAPAPSPAPPAPRPRGSRWLVGCLIAAVVVSLGSLTLAYYLIVGTDEAPSAGNHGPSMTPLGTTPASVEPLPMQPPAVQQPPPVVVVPPVGQRGPTTVTMTPMGTPGQAHHHVSLGFGTVVGDPRLVGPVNLWIRQREAAFTQCFATHPNDGNQVLIFMLQWRLSPDPGQVAPAQVEARGAAPPAVLRCLEGVVAEARFVAPTRLTQCSFPITVTSLAAPTEDD